MPPIITRRHIRYKGTKTFKESAQRQLSRFRDKINEACKDDPSFWNPRIKNLMEDIDDLNWDVDKLSDTELWPSDFTERFKNINDTIKRLGINVGLI